MLLLNLIRVAIITSSALRFDLDWAVFKHSADSVRIEFYYGVGFDQLDFHPQENYLTAHFRVEFRMTGIDHQFSQSGTIFKRARLKNFQEAITKQRTFVDQFSVIVLPGHYETKVTIADSQNSGTVIDTIYVSDFNKQLDLSSIQIGAAIVTDTLTTGFALVPNPGHRFIVGKNHKLFAYFEMYSLESEPKDYQLRYHLIDTISNDTVFNSERLFRAKARNKSATALEIALDSIPPGVYRLTVEAVCQQQLAKKYTVVNLTPQVSTQPAVVPYKLQLTPHEEKYYRELQFIATPRELEYYNSLSPEGREAYLAWFWSKHNLTEFVRRREVVESRFGTVKVPGIKTDRGKIYVKYGEPDAVERKAMEMEVKPREYWFYYQLGLTFIFIDVRGDGNYRLAWTNSPDEPQTGFEHLLTPEEQNQYR